MENRFFYHSFPRPKRDEALEATGERALEILQFMTSFGLILAPEVVSWDVSGLASKKEEVKFFQRRSCFTELATDELLSHSNRFGPLSLEFDIDALRAIGAMPVIYIPQAVSGNLTSSLATFAVRGAVALKHVLEQLANVEQAADPQKALALAQAQFGIKNVSTVVPDYNLTLQNVDANGSVVQSYDMKAKDVAAFTKYMQFNSIPFSHSIGMLELLQSTFYPTDDLHSGSLLGYYRQREWRVVSHRIGFPKPICVDLEVAQKARLLEIDNEFWSKHISDDKNTQRRVDLAQVYLPADDWRLVDNARRIIAPQQLIQRIRDIVGSKVSISSL